MFKDRQSEEYSSNLIREAKITRKNNRVFILQYSPERTVSKKKNLWEGDEADPKKQINYIIKKQSLREQSQKLSPTQTEINHRSNIDRLINLISKSKNQPRNNESGCQKMVRALAKLSSGSWSLSCMKWAIQSLKKYTMTCSSNNFELFIQSKHLNIKEAPKITDNHIHKQNFQRQKTLEKIAEYSEEYLMKNDNSGISIANELNSPQSRKQYMKYAQNSLHSIEKQTWQKDKRESAGYLTTRQELASQQYLNIPTRDVNFEVNKSKNIRLCLPKACIFSKFQLQKSFEKVFESEKKSNPLVVIPKDFQYKQILQDQQTFPSQIECKKQLDKCYIANKPVNSTQKKCNSPIFSLMYALPTEVNQQSLKAEKKVLKSHQNNHKKYQPGDKQLNQKKKQEVLTPSEYAQKMLFGMPQSAQQKVSKEYRHLLQEKSRKRVSSLPKITFTYVSRQKYDADYKIVQRNPQFIQNNSPFQPKHSASKNSSKEQLHSTFQSKAAQPKPRQNIQINQQQSQHQKQLKNSSSRQKLVVVQQPIASSKIIRNQYYGDPYQMNRQIPQNLEMKRERILTAQPGWQKQVEFVGIQQQQMPGCCWQQKQIRSRSLNQRVLVRNSSQNNIVFR